MKKIYLVLSYTGTLLSRIVKVWTRKEFSHISISLDENLEEMYSFGRRNAYNPFVGRFVHEYTDKGTFKRFKNTKCAIYYLEIPDESFEIISNKIYEMYPNRDTYKFNLLGLLAVSINKKITRENYYYCAEFIKYLFELANIEQNLPYIIKPEDFKNIDGVTEIYSGYLRNYEPKEIKPIA